jgi:hypothetical protein
MDVSVELFHVASPSRAWTKPDVVETWVAGFWFRIAAKTVEPERGMPERKCSVLFMGWILYQASIKTQTL